MPFIAIDLFNKEVNSIRGCFVVKSDVKTHYTVGRGTDCEIRLSDISVSRNHAILSYEKGYWQLTDSKSKFGTLLLVDEPVDLMKLKRQSNFQIGKTVVQINMKMPETNNCLGACGKKTVENTLPLNPFEVIEDDPYNAKETEKDDKDESVVVDVNNDKIKDMEKSKKMTQNNVNPQNNLVLNNVPENSQNLANNSGNMNNNNPQQGGFGINIQQDQENIDLSDIFEYGDNQTPNNNVQNSNNQGMNSGLNRNHTNVNNNIQQNNNVQNNQGGSSFVYNSQLEKEQEESYEEAGEEDNNEGGEEEEDEDDFEFEDDEDQDGNH